MNPFLGAVLVLLAGGGAGLSVVREMNRQLRQTEDMQQIVRRMKTEICLRRLPLPIMLAELEKAFPPYFAGAGEASALLAEVSFEELWRACIRAIRLYPALEELLCRLGTELSRGEPPQEVLDICSARLHEMRSSQTQRREEMGRVYVTAGFAAGGLLVILML